jgi:hypothetical protein
MGRHLEDILTECLEAVAQGQRTVEDCLILYPESAEHLEPELRLALRLREAYYDAGPPADFQAAARERFLSAVQARGVASRPARRLLPVPVLISRLRRPLPALALFSRLHWRPAPAGWRPVAAAIALSFIVGFLGFSTFAVASSGDSLPGDWRYPVKRLTERTRLAFTFGDDARRDYRITLAEERLHEVQKLAGQERPISESVLRQLIDSTAPLVQTVEPSSVPADQIERITDLTAQQQDVLSTVAPLVEDNAVEELQEAMVVSSEGHDKAVQALATLAQQNPQWVPRLSTPGTTTPTPGAGASATAGATPGLTPTPEATATPESGISSPTPEPEATLNPGEPTAEPPPPTATPAAPEPERLLLSDDTTGGITWNLLRIGDFSVRVPAPEEGAWVVSILQSAPGRQTVFVGHHWGNRFDTFVTVSVATGDASVGVLVNGTLLAASPEEVAKLAPALKEIILHIVDSANVASS